MSGTRSASRKARRAREKHQEIYYGMIRIAWWWFLPYAKQLFHGKPARLKLLKPRWVPPKTDPLLHQRPALLSWRGLKGLRRQKWKIFLP